MALGRKLLLVLMFCLMATSGFAAAIPNYYVDTDAADGGDGSVGSPFDHLMDWEALNVDLTAYDAGTSIVYCSGVTADTNTVTIAGWTTNDTHKIKIIGDNTTGAESTSCYRLSGITLGGAGTILTLTNNYITISNIEITAITTSSENTGVGIYLEGTNEIIENCIIHDFATLTYGIIIAIQNNGVNNQIYNNLIYDISGYQIRGILQVDSGTSLKVYNNTIYNLTGTTYGQGIATDYTDRQNNIVIGCTTDYTGGTSMIVDNYNMSLDATAAGANSLTGKTAANTWTAATTGDFTLKTGSEAIGAGADLSGTLTTDIIGATRSTWDMGAFYKAASVASTSPPFFSIINVGD